MKAYVSDEGPESRPSTAGTGELGRIHRRVIVLALVVAVVIDGFQIPCSDQAVHVAFSLETCDREVISWCAGTSAISGELIRDLMLQSVEQRFKSTATPHPVQWLSDNGSCYRAHETIEFATRLGLVPCFTPPRSPQSNGIVLRKNSVMTSEMAGGRNCGMIMAC